MIVTLETLKALAETYPELLLVDYLEAPEQYPV